MMLAELEKMRVLFCDVHAVGEKGRPFTDYMWSGDEQRRDDCDDESCDDI